MGALGIQRFAAIALALELLAGCGHVGSLPTGTRNAGLVGVMDAAGLSEEGPRSTAQTLTVPAHPLSAPQPVTTGNEAVLSVGPAETFPAIKAFVQNAHETLWIEMFEFGSTYAQQLVPLICERAKAGVKVRLLLDQAGSEISPKGIRPYEQALRDAGVELNFYPARLRRDGLKWRFNITHRKLMLADGQVAMAGGTNFGTTFETTTRDLMVRWRGPVVGELYKEFGTEWHFVTGQALPLPPAPAPAGDVDARVAVTSVPEGRFEIRDAVIDQIDHAQSEILIEQQYLWEDNLDDHLVAACKRGVKVRVIVPGGTKEQAVLASLNDDAVQRLVAAGAEAHMYVDPAAPVSHLHVKYFSIDNRWVATGSCNGDARSLMDHQELDVLTTSPAFVAEVRDRLFEHDWAQMSHPWQSHNIPWWDKAFRSVLELVDYLF